MHKKTVIIPVRFAVAVECEYTDDGTLVGTSSAFHSINAAAAARPGEEDAWDACLEIPPTTKDGSDCEGWPDYQETARQRLAMELGRPIWWEGERDG